MQTYLVGGAVRDQLLGRSVKDHDWVVTGATPEEMLEAGFTKVGADFPVYLDSKGEEYALARQERKTGPGYHGFETEFGPEVTIEEDLCRRDLTINAMARNSDNALIDPYGGQKDLKNGILRHVSVAFAEDPVRVLRVARFAARYNFEIHESTWDLMEELVKAKELDHLTPERVWAELEKTMCEDYPHRFFWAMDWCGATDVLFPELKKVIQETGVSLERAALSNATLIERFMILFSNFNVSDIESMCDRLKAPSAVKMFAVKYNRFLKGIDEVVTHDDMLALMKTLDLFRNPDHLYQMVRVRTLGGIKRSLFTFCKAFRAAKRVSFASLGERQQQMLRGTDIGAAIDALRLKAINEIL